jgi:hypothetical protein
MYTRRLINVYDTVHSAVRMSPSRTVLYSARYTFGTVSTTAQSNRSGSVILVAVAAAAAAAG